MCDSTFSDGAKWKNRFELGHPNDNRFVVSDGFIATSPFGILHFHPKLYKKIISVSPLKCFEGEHNQGWYLE